MKPILMLGSTVRLLFKFIFLFFGVRDRPWCRSVWTQCSQGKDNLLMLFVWDKTAYLTYTHPALTLPVRKVSLLVISPGCHFSLKIVEFTCKPSQTSCMYPAVPYTESDLFVTSSISSVLRQSRPSASMHFPSSQLWSGRQMSCFMWANGHRSW